MGLFSIFILYVIFFIAHKESQPLTGTTKTNGIVDFCSEALACQCTIPNINCSNNDRFYNRLLPKKLKYISNYTSYFNFDLSFIQLDNQLIDKLGLNELQVINIINFNGNLLKNLTAPLFRTNAIIKKLILSNNRIRLIEETFFKNWCNTTEALDISANELLFLPKHVFKYCRSLSVLNLANNTLTLRTDTFVDCPELTVLNLSFNNLDLLPTRIFEKNIKLNHLDLMGNRLISFDFFQRRMHFLNLDLNTGLIPVSYHRQFDIGEFYYQDTNVNISCFFSTMKNVQHNDGANCVDLTSLFAQLKCTEEMIKSAYNEIQTCSGLNPFKNYDTSLAMKKRIIEAIFNRDYYIV